MGQVLYRKYRSKNFGEIVGQEHITTALQNALKNERISHAYLFTGPRGTGKTSIARILAHAVNDLPYDEKTSYLDIIEIDAASNRRIDEIRDLRERVRTAPSHAKYKVYIIDEVHMLTREAFNALLKTLEEPPDHAIFILATTEAHKLPETIVSRTQRFSFRPVSNEQIMAHLRSIADKEQIAIDDVALQLIAEHGSGSFRDSISLLDQAGSLGMAVKLSNVQEMLGIAPNEAISSLIEAISACDTPGIIKLLQSLRSQGLNPANIAAQLGRQLRELLLTGDIPLEERKLLELLKELLAVTGSPEPYTSLEIALLGASLSGQPYKESTQQIPKVVAKEKPVASVTVSTELKATKSKPTKVAQPTNSSYSEVWQQVLNALKKKHNTLYGVARMAVAELNKEELVLIFQFPFHQKRLSDSHNQQIVCDIIREISGLSVTVRCIVDSSNRADVGAVKAEVRKDSGTIEAISNIFGPSEVLE